MKFLPPTRIGLAMFVLSMTTLSYAQHLSSSRAIGIGGFTALTKGLAALDWNPAGLTSLSNWEAEATSFYSRTGGSSPSLYAGSIGNRFGDRQFAALRISP